VHPKSRAQDPPALRERLRARAWAPAAILPHGQPRPGPAEATYVRQDRVAAVADSIEDPGCVRAMHTGWQPILAGAKSGIHFSGSHSIDRSNCH
jgi:hypothetical protein